MNYRGGMWEGGGWAGWSGVKGGEWDNCNSIINKYIFKKNLKKNEDNMRSLWNISKCTNIWIIGMPEEEEEQEIENLFEKIMKENFPNLVKEIAIQVHKAQRVPNKLHAEDHTKTHHD